MNKYATYFALEKQLHNQGHDVTRVEIIEQFTDDHKSSLKELTGTEYRELIVWLRRSFELGDKQPKWQNSPENRMRRKVIANLRRYGFKLDDGSSDMEAINNWCITKGHAHKPLNQYSKSELVKLVTQAENMYLKEIERK